MSETEMAARPASSAWQPRSPWEGHARPGRHGRAEGAPGLILQPRGRSGLALLIAAPGRDTELGNRLAAHLGWSLPEPGRTRIAGERGLIWAAPGQWLALAEAPEDLRELDTLLDGVAAVTDQSDGRAVVRVSGARAREALAKGVTVDLHPRAFGPGQTAVTGIAHIGAQLWQRDAEPTYDIAVARSFAGSFWDWLTAASAEFGYVVEPGPRA